jgi:hypothetical protein
LEASAVSDDRDLASIGTAIIREMIEVRIAGRGREGASQCVMEIDMSCLICIYHRQAALRLCLGLGGCANASHRLSCTANTSSRPIAARQADLTDAHHSYTLPVNEADASEEEHASPSHAGPEAVAGARGPSAEVLRNLGSSSASIFATRTRHTRLANSTPCNSQRGAYTITNRIFCLLFTVWAKL